MQHLPDTAWPAPVIYPDLAGKVAVITGGSRGIGAATASAFAANRVAGGKIML